MNKDELIERLATAARQAVLATQSASDPANLPEEVVSELDFCVSEVESTILGRAIVLVNCMECGEVLVGDAAERGFCDDCSPDAIE